MDRIWLGVLFGRLGDVVRAERVLTEVEATREAAEFEYWQEPLATALVRLRWAQGVLPAGEAHRRLVTLLAGALSAGRTSAAIKILALLAVIRQSAGDREPALSALRQALEMALPERYCRSFVDEGEPMRALLGALRGRLDRRREAALLAYIDLLLGSFGGRPAVLGAAAGLVEPLTEREREVLALIAAGRSNRDIAAQLVLSVATVKKHINNIYGKMRVNSRTQALLRARELNLLE